MDGLDQRTMEHREIAFDRQRSAGSSRERPWNKPRQDIQRDVVNFTHVLALLSKLRGCACVFCVLCLLFSGVILRGAGDGELSSNSVPVTFESFLKNPPVIEDAEFEIKNPPPSTEVIAIIKQHAKQFPNLAAHPEILNTRTNPCWLLLDKTNYILYRPAMDGYSGRFGSITWALIGDSLKLVDRKMNAPEGDWLAEQTTSMRPVRRLLNLGIEDMVFDTIEWTNGVDHFTAECEQVLDGVNTNKGEIEVQLHYVKGIVLSATTMNKWGKETEVTYKYDPSFFGGQLPIGFDVVKKSQDLSVSPTKLFSLQIKKLQLAKNPIDMARFDPKVVLKGKYKMLIVESNNVEFAIRKNGKMQAVMSPEDVQRNEALAREQRDPQANSIVKIVLAIALVAPPIVFFMKRFRQGGRKPEKIPDEENKPQEKNKK